MNRNTITADEYCAALRETWSEAVFLEAVKGRAKSLGWLAAHFRPAKTSRGWRTAVQGDGKGFPDLILVRREVVFAELKVPPNEASAEQISWLAALRGAGERAYLWTPDDWDTICEVLR